MRSLSFLFAIASFPGFLAGLLIGLSSTFLRFLYDFYIPFLEKVHDLNSLFHFSRHSLLKLFIQFCYFSADD